MLSDAKIERPVKTFRRSTELLVDRDRAAEQNGSDSSERSAHRRSRDGRCLLGREVAWAGIAEERRVRPIHPDPAVGGFASWKGASAADHGLSAERV